MTGAEHNYRVRVEWTGNTGQGTSSTREYSRDHVIRAGDKPAIAGSADPAFRGDPTRWNPEELQVAALATCHQLSYLFLCAVAGVTVTSYRDDASGTMTEERGSARFTRVLLRPQVAVRHGDDLDLARRLHRDAHAKCFIANSVNFPVDCEPTVTEQAANAAS